MRIWLHATAKSSSLGSSTAISVVAHAVLVSAAVYGTGMNARQLEKAIADRVSYLHYLPPPDRRPSSSNVVEHLQFIDVGTRGAVLPERVDGSVAAPIGTAKAKRPGGDQGDELRPVAPSQAFESQDSVYSMLDVEETAARTAGSAAPIYPPDLMKEGMEGGVFIRFVVDSSGRADSASIEVIRSTHPSFAQSVRQAVPLMLFTPATVGGHHVRQMVEQNFQFRLKRPAPAEHTRVKPVP